MATVGDTAAALEQHVPVGGWFVPADVPLKGGNWYALSAQGRLRRKALKQNDPRRGVGGAQFEYERLW